MVNSDKYDTLYTVRKILVLSQAQQVELTKAMANSVDSAFKQVSNSMMAQLRQQTANDNQPPSSRRDVNGKKGASATAGMEANRRLTSSIKNLNKHVGAAADIFGDLNKTAKGYHSELERTMRLYGQVQDQMAVTFRAHRRMRDVIGKDVKAITERMKMEEDRVKAEKEYTDHLKEMKKAAKDFVDEVRSSSNNAPGGAGNNNNAPRGRGNDRNDPKIPGKDVIGEFVSEVSGKLLGLASISKGLTDTFSDFHYALKTSSQLTTNTLTDSLKMGMTARELLEMQAEFRQDAMRSTGGVIGWTKELRKSQMDLVVYTGSLKEANKVNAQLRSSYLQLGMSLDDISGMLGKTSDGMISNFTKMSAITGKTIGEVTKIMTSITNSDENREMLLKMTKEQRIEYVKSQATMLRQYTVLTGSVERAQAIMEQQNRNRNKTAIDRFKESVRMRAAGGMVGIDSSTMERFAELNNRAPGSLNADEFKELADARNAIAQRVKDLQGSDNFQEQLMGDQLVAKLDLQNLDVFNRSMDVSMNQDAVIEQQQQNLAATIDGLKYGKESIALLTSINSILNQSLTPLVASVMMIAARSVMKTSPGLDILDALGDRRSGGDEGERRSGKKKFGVIGNRSRSMLAGREMLMNAQAYGSKLGQAGKLLAKGGAPTALVAQAGAFALDKVWTPETSDGTKAKEMTMDTIDTASMALMGATIGSFIAPGVGTAIGAALGGVVGAAYAFSNDDYFKTVSELEASRHDNESRKHAMEMKLVQAEFEYRKNNLDAFRQEAGPGFESKMQELLEKHNAGLDASQQVTLDGFAKYEDLRATLSQSLNEEELARMDELYRDEKNQMASRHQKQMENMRQIHNLNLQQTDAYKEVMKIESTMKALEDFDTNGWFSADDIDADDLQTALGQSTVEDSAAVLRDIAKNSGALTADEFNRIASSGTFAQMANDLKNGGSFDFDDIDDAAAQQAMRKLFASMESGEDGNEYLKKRLQTRLDQQNAIVADLDSQVVQREVDTVSNVTQGRDDKEMKDLTDYIASNMSNEDLQAAGFKTSADLMQRLSVGDEVYSPELRTAIAEFDHLKNGGELTKQVATNGGMVTANVVPGSVSDDEIRIKRGTRLESQTAEQMLYDRDDANMLKTYLGELGLSTDQMVSMGGNSVNEIVEKALSGGLIESQSLLRYMENARMSIDPKYDRTDVKAEQDIIKRVQNAIPTVLRDKKNVATIQPPFDPNAGLVDITPKIGEVAPTATESTQQPSISTIEKSKPVGSDLQAQAASVGTNNDMYANIKAIQADKKRNIEESADAAVADGAITSEEILEQLKLLNANNVAHAQKMFDHYRSIEDESKRQHIENQIFGEKRMQDMRAGKAGS